MHKFKPRPGSHDFTFESNPNHNLTLLSQCQQATPVQTRDTKDPNYHCQAHDDEPSSTAGRPTNSTRPNFNIVDGHDYTYAQFVEIDKNYKEDVLIKLPETGALELLRLTGANGPGRKYQGGWRDLFAEKTRWDKMRWISLPNLRRMAAEAKVNKIYRFRAWFCPPGLIHIEYDDDGSWSYYDILTLPSWLLVG